MANYRETTVKLTNTKLSKLKSAAKNKTGTTLKITKKNSIVSSLTSNNKTKN